MISRTKTFNAITKKVNKNISWYSKDLIVCEGDSLKLLKEFPDKSISLVLTDPPYHTTKKHNIVGDTSFEDDEKYLSWLSNYVKEWKRILKPNGSIFCFCSSKMAARIELLFEKEFNVLSHVVWTKPNAPGFDGWKQKMCKEALRQWYGHTERIIFAEPAEEGNLSRSYCANFLKETRKKSGLSSNQLTEFAGAYGKVNHGGAVSNWETGRNIPSREQYSKICNGFISTGKITEMPDYEDIIRPFMVDSSKEFTDVWNFESVRPYKGKHPAEKPLNMLVHAIEATTYAEDIILDCFAGSGNTSIAANMCGRKSIAIEIDSALVKNICQKLENLEHNKSQVIKEKKVNASKNKKVFKEKQLSLFS